MASKFCHSTQLLNKYKPNPKKLAKGLCFFRQNHRGSLSRLDLTNTEAEVDVFLRTLKSISEFNEDEKATAKLNSLT